MPGAVRNAAGGEIDFPLRILVQSDMVGAIIGRGGQTIRSITQQTRWERMWVRSGCVISKAQVTPLLRHIYVSYL